MMITIGVVFYCESSAQVTNFFQNLSKSVQASLHKPKFIFVFNSPCSSDMQRILKLADAHLKKKYIAIQSNENNIGSSRNIILENAETEFVYFSDPDVLLFEDTLATLISEAQNIEGKNVIGLTGPVLSITQSSGLKFKLMMIDKLIRTTGFAFQGYQGTRQFLDHGCTSHLLIHRPTAMQIGSFSHRYPFYGEDLDFSFRSALNQKIFLNSKSSVRHDLGNSYFKFLQKTFKYGRAQALVFANNGIIFKMIYRLLPTVLTILFGVFMVLAFRGNMLNRGFHFWALLFSVVVLFDFVFVYSSGTLFEILNRAALRTSRQFEKQPIFTKNK